MQELRARIAMLEVLGRMNLRAMVSPAILRNRISLISTGTQKPEVQNARALVVLRRVKDKLTGHDFKPNEELTIPDQVDKLIQQATSLEVISDTCYGPVTSLINAVVSLPALHRMVQFLVETG